MIRGAPWRRKASQIGLRGFIRATEITWGDANGWHPHLHILLFLDRPLSTDAFADLEGWIYERWRGRLVKSGLREPTRLRGIDLRPVGTDGRLVAQYLAKVQGEAPSSMTRVHLELARSDMKGTRGGSGARLSPFELLDDDCALSRRRCERLWDAYVSATRGRRAFHWSKGLRELLALDSEASDAEILAEAEQSESRFVIPGAVWDELRQRPDQLAAVLEAVDLGDIGAATQLARGELLALCDGAVWVDPISHECRRPRVRARAEKVDVRHSFSIRAGTGLRRY